jgi:hypothetical protein
MNSYEQAVAERDNAATEIQRIDREIAGIQQNYDSIASVPRSEHSSFRGRERERNDLARQLNELVSERSRWLAERNESERRIEHELENLIHAWRGEQIHQEQAVNQAHSSAEAAEAGHRRDEAADAVQQHADELEKMHADQADREDRSKR